MNIQVAKWWEGLRSSYWFTPTVMCGGAIGLSFAMIAVDRQVQASLLRNIDFIWMGGAEGARGMLETIGSSMITVAGVVFSITIAALTLASQQFGPRLLRNFMRDPGNQIVLGSFVSTFIYSLLVLRTVRSSEETTFVPYIAVNVAFLLAIISIGMLIYYIHHIAVSLQASHLAATVGHDLRRAIDDLYPPVSEHTITEELDGVSQVPEDFARWSAAVLSDSTGYISAVSENDLLEIASRQNLIVRMERRPGDFVVEGDVLMRAFPSEEVKDQVVRDLRRSYVISERRSPTSDIEFTSNQLVEIAVRALSPGINDPFTANTCLDWLGAAVSAMAGRPQPPRLALDEEGKLRLIQDRPVDFESFCDAIFNPIREYGRGSAMVMVRALEVIGAAGPHATIPEHRRVLEKHAALIARSAMQAMPAERDHQDLADRHALAIDRIRANGLDDGLS